jgi:hypothetical protein
MKRVLDAACSDLSVQAAWNFERAILTRGNQADPHGDVTMPRGKQNDRSRDCVGALNPSRRAGYPSPTIDELVEEKAEALPRRTTFASELCRARQQDGLHWVQVNRRVAYDLDGQIRGHRSCSRVELCHQDLVRFLDSGVPLVGVERTESNPFRSQGPLELECPTVHAVSVEPPRIGRNGRWRPNARRRLGFHGAP